MSITKPMDSGEEFYYINYDVAGDSACLEYMFARQVGIGPTLNLDWIWNNGGNILSMRGMFDGCANLEEISMPNYKPGVKPSGRDPIFMGIIVYYEYTFRNCHRLKKIEYGPYLFAANDGSDGIGNMVGTFENCYDLKYINFQHVDADAYFSVPNYSDEPTDTIFKNCNSLQAIFIGNWDELGPGDRKTITDKFNNLLQLSGINPDTIYIGKYDLTVIH